MIDSIPEPAYEFPNIMPAKVNDKLPKVQDEKPTPQ